MKTGTPLVEVSSLMSANSVSIALYGSESRTPKSGQNTSMQRLDLPEPCVPQTNSEGNAPTFFMMRGFMGVAKNQPSIGSTTCGWFTFGKHSKTTFAMDRKVSSSVGR
jgi:hypothetical protein